jgi:hypothetical protein
MNRATFCAILVGLTAVGQPSFAQPSHRKLQVVIVGVTKFDIVSYNNPVLTDSISQRCRDLQDFFNAHLGAGNISIHEYCTPELTTRESLRHLFSVEIPSLSANTVTMIFLMSHGEAISFKNGFLNSDVEIIASDTKTSDEQNDARGERLFSSLLLGSEVFSWLQRAPAGSTILMFVDTCHSGAAASLSASLLTFLQQQFGLGTLVISSALPGDNTYQAEFTQALMTLWDKGNNCLNQDTLPNDIFREMSKEVPLSGTEGLPTFVVQYSGPVCLGNFGKDRKLLFIYAGPDAKGKPYSYQIAEDTSTGPNYIINGFISYPYLPIPLDSKKYVVTIKRDPDVDLIWNIDLGTSGPQVIWLDSAAAPTDVGKFSEAMVATAQRNGSPPLEIATLREQAVEVYRAIGKDSDATRLEAEIRDGLGRLVSPVVRALAFKVPSEFTAILDRAEAKKDDGVAGFLGFGGGFGSPAEIPARDEIGHELELLGDFRNAAALYSKAARMAESTGDMTERAKFADEAYFALGAAGEPQAAKEIRERFSISVGSLSGMELQALKDKSGPALQTYRALSIIHALSGSPTKKLNSPSR